MVVLPVGPAPSPASYEVEQNDEAVSALQVASLTDVGTGVGIVFAVDTSNAMGREQAMDNVKAALTAAVAAKPANQQFAIVSFGVSARVVSNFTTNADHSDQRDRDAPPLRSSAPNRRSATACARHWPCSTTRPCRATSS